MYKSNYPPNISAEKGAVLVVGLIMVLLISIVALSAIRNSNLQEAMAGNMRDRNVAFQGAESALVMGEAIVDVRLVAQAPNCTGKETCYLKLNELPKDSVVYLDAAGFKLKARDTGITLEGSNDKLHFMIEELTTFTPQMDGGALDESNAAELASLTPYRVTALGFGVGPSANVILQSTYNRAAQ